MVATPLVEQDIRQGAEVVQALDKENFRVVAAIWYYSSELDEWELLIGTPSVSRFGAKFGYLQIQLILTRAKIDFSIDRIRVISSNDPLITEFRFFAGTDKVPFIGSTYLKRSVIGDTSVEAAYIYRAERLVGESGNFKVWLGRWEKEKKVWKAAQGIIYTEDGLAVRIEYPLALLVRQTHSRNGINARVHVLIDLVKKGQGTIGDVQRWDFRDGKLHSVDVVARDARVVGVPDQFLEEVTVNGAE